MWPHLLTLLLVPVLAQTATPSATNAPTPTIVPTPTPLPLTISGIPSQVTKNQQFSVGLNLHVKANVSYQIKVYGGVNGDNYSIEDQNGDSWINGYNGAWDSLPQIVTDTGGSATPNLNLRFKIDKTSGTCQLTAKIKETASNTYVLSTIYNLDVIDPPLPTSTPTPTVSPPTNTPIPTATPKPSLTPTTTPTSPPTIEPTPTVILISPTGEVLGFSETASPTTIIKKDLLVHIFSMLSN